MRITDGFSAGLNVAFMPGFGVLLGAAVFESEELSSGSDLSPGDTLAAGQDVPTKKVFNSYSPGFFLGVNVTTEVWQSLFPNQSDSGS